MLRYLLDGGLGHAALVEATIADLESMSLGEEGVKLRRRCLDRRGVVCVLSAEAPAFVTTKGALLDDETLAPYLSSIRCAGVNAEFNGALCRGLLAVRFDSETPLKSASPRAVESRAP